MVDLINHDNSPIWTAKNLRLSSKSNGARVYSEAITKYYFPVFQEVFGKSDKKVLVVSVMAENEIIRFGAYDYIFIFLHECSYLRQPVISRAMRIRAANGNAKVCFVVWHEDTMRQLKSHNLDAMFVPMAIDLEEMETYKRDNIPKYADRLIYFGHIRSIKRPYFEYLKDQCQKKGYKLDWISNSRFNGNSYRMSRNEIFEKIQHYRYGVGVGQCAHEMAALGLKVFLYAYNFKCNFPTTEQEAEYYLHRNLCSDNETKVLVEDALKNLDSLVPFKPIGIREEASQLREKISKLKI